MHVYEGRALAMKQLGASLTTAAHLFSVPASKRQYWSCIFVSCLFQNQLTDARDKEVLEMTAGDALPLWGVEFRDSLDLGRRESTVIARLVPCAHCR